jgi:hypothetical protein
MLSPRFRCSMSGCSQMPRGLHKRNVVAQLVVAALSGRPLKSSAALRVPTFTRRLRLPGIKPGDRFRRFVADCVCAPTGLNRVARIGIGLTDTGVCPSSRSRGVSRLRGHNIPLRGPRQAGAADGTDRAPGGGVRAGAYVSNRARMDHDCSASSRMAAIMGARLSGWVIRRSVPRSPRWPTVTGQSW